MKIYAIVILLALFALGCAPTPEETAAKELRANTSFWATMKSSARGAGPFAHITREPFELPDGSFVVCVSTAYGLWCKEANERLH